MIKEILTSLWQPIEHYGPKIPELIVTIVIGILLVKLLLMILSRSLRVIRISRALSNVLISIISVILWVLLFSELARQAGMTNLAFTISGSIVVIGLALANGASTLTSDIISGIYLAKDQDFEIGYRVKIGDIEGIIRKVDMRKVRVRDDEGKLHIFPNNVVDKADWVVLAREPEEIDDKTNIDNKKRSK
jgi:small conductance mechanosensitive channel